MVYSPSHIGPKYPTRAEDYNCGCGQPAIRTPMTDKHLCDGCWFRFKVMKAAGRAKEFWDAQKWATLRESNIAGWVSYNIKYYSVAKPDSIIRLRRIDAESSVI